MSDKAQLDRIESKLDALLAALAYEESGEEPVVFGWDGEQLPPERDQSQPL